MFFDQLLKKAQGRCNCSVTPVSVTWAWRPGTKAQQPRHHFMVCGFFASMSMPARTWLRFTVDRVVTPAREYRFLCPVRQPCTYHHLCLAAEAMSSNTCRTGARHG